MQGRVNDFSKRGAEILVISFAPASSLEDQQSYLKLSFEIASDPAQAAYKSYGLKKAPFFTVWHPKVVWKYAVLMSKGRKPQTPPKDEDLTQLGGDFVIDENGRVLFAFSSPRADVRPPVDELLDALK